ncbi:hypothetical protein HDV00_006247 [Rhizophlyctis rosea]|nr:hypothetical protein HDV00_006247 [Rhizophlyctis rosea]
MSTRRISRLILDFDETITIADTIATIAATAYASRSSHKTLQSTEIPPWSFFQEAYLNDWNSHIPPPPPLNPSVASLRAHIQSYRTPVERKSIDRVQQYRALSGTTASALFTAGTAVATRPGWIEAVKLFVSKGKNQEDNNSSATVKIVSLNWSKDLIQGVLHTAGLTDIITRKSLLCNDLECDEKGISTGIILGGILTGVDKADWMGSDVVDGMSICIGDR